MSKLLKILLLLFILFNPNLVIAKDTNKDMVIAQMNSCVNTLTNIINNKSMTVLEHETDQLLNNLTMEHIVGLYEIEEFREKLIDEIGSLSINEEERKLLRRINNIKLDNLKWKAFNEALNNTMLLTGGGNTEAQLGFQMLVTAARSGLEYKVAQNELEIDELQAMWDLYKSDLEHFISLRKTAISIIYSLYQKYNLKESDRLTEQSSMQFNRIVTGNDANKMIRLLKDNEKMYGHLADYYYFLGMAYVDTENYAQALEAFNKYEQLYAKAPIYRINEKLGLIALTRIAYYPGRPAKDVEKDITIALSNLPNNDMAIVQCAAVYSSIFNNPIRALSILRVGLDKDMIEDKSAILALASFLLREIDPEDSIYQEFISSYNNLTVVDLDTAIDLNLALKKDLFESLKQIMSIKDCASRRYFFGEYVINDKFEICLPKKFIINPSEVNVFIEKHDEDDVELKRYLLSSKDAVTLKEINDVSCFKENPNLKYLFFSKIGDDEYVVKANIDCNAVLDNPSYLKINSYFPKVEDKDKQAIVKFLKKHERSVSDNIYVAKKYESSKEKVIKAIRWYYDPFYGWNQSIANEVLKTLSHTDNQKNCTYLRLFFNDSKQLEICYKLNESDGSLIPCYYTDGGKRVFADKSFQKEFADKSVKIESSSEKTPELKKKEKSWWKFWGGEEEEVKEKPSTEKKPEIKKEEKSWWKFWSSDDEEEVKEKSSTEKKPEIKKEEKSWWKFWSSDDEEEVKEKSSTEKKPEMEIKKEEKSWWKFCGSDDEEEVKEKPSTEKKPEVKKNEKPWWKFWGNVDSNEKK